MHLTRRRFLSAAGAAGAGGLAGGAVPAAGSGRPAGDGSGPNPAFFGEHQAGIATPTQEHLQFGAFDVVSGSPEDLRQLLVRWSSAAASMTRGRAVGPLATGSKPPVDSGEQLGLGAAGLTVTFGFGPSLFSHGRFGLESMRPAPLVDLPPFSVDALQHAISGGDLAVQVCADDPQVAFHALHSLIRMAAPVAVPRWVLAGFGRTGNTAGQPTPRNLMGFKDGTANVVGQDSRALSRWVWAGAPDSPAWMQGGSYMVVRRIKMLLAGWDATSLDEQEQTVGRHKISGAPLGERREHAPIDLNAQVGGRPVIPASAHIRLASPAYNGGVRLLRRGYSYVDGIDSSTKSIAAGLLFICYQRDPTKQFIRIQNRLSLLDALVRHLEHVGSAIFACPPGAAQGGFVGETLFA